MEKVKALVLFSGGLDSMLVVKLLQAQNITVTGLCFHSIFFNCEQAKKAAESLEIELKVINISEKILALVKNPPSGYGKHLNPCIDCHSLMIREAGEHLTPRPLLGKEREKQGVRSEKLDYDFIATGEVLGQRPFSQNREAMQRIDSIAGVEVLRPLSAKLLPETKAERNGLVNRHRLLNAQGRSREKQLELVEKYKIDSYATPAGGCLLTDPDFSERLIKLLDNWPDCSTNDAALLKRGRVFWLKDKKQERILIVIGRHKEDNEELEKLAKDNDIMLELKEINGPTAIIRAKAGIKLDLPDLDINITVPEQLKFSELKLGQVKEKQEILNIVALLTGYYAVKARGKQVEVIYK